MPPWPSRFARVVRVFANWPLHYLNGWGLLKGPDAELRTRDGLRLRVRTGTSDWRTSRSVLADRSYLADGGELPRDAIVVDVGAHIGSFTLLAAWMAPEGRVLAYEPEPSNFEMLERNVGLNGLTHVRAAACAVGGVAGERELFFSAKPSSTGGHSLVRPGGRSIRVRCTTLDRIVADEALDRIDFLKLDCEGAERELLEGASAETLARVRRGAMEVHGGRDAIEQVLREAGFSFSGGAKPNYLYFRRGR
jgi:FkbM family methyltransferase